jgi:hypothetical protein
MSRIHREIGKWRVELAGALALACVLVLGTISTQAQTQWLNYQCTGTTCQAYGTCPSPTGCTVGGASCGSYVYGTQLKTCASGNNTQYCNIPGTATCTNFCQCYCTGTAGNFSCDPTYNNNWPPQPICNAQGTNGYCNNPPS